MRDFCALDLFENHARAEGNWSPSTTSSFVDPHLHLGLPDAQLNMCSVCAQTFTRRLKIMINSWRVELSRREGQSFGHNVVAPSLKTSMQRRPLKIERIGGKIFVNKDDTLLSLQSIHTTLAEEFEIFGIACQENFVQHRCGDAFGWKDTRQKTYLCTTMSF